MQIKPINPKKFAGSQVPLEHMIFKKVYLNIHILAFAKVLSDLQKGQVIVGWCGQRKQYDGDRV